MVKRVGLWVRDANILVEREVSMVVKCSYVIQCRFVRGSTHDAVICVISEEKGLNLLGIQSTLEVLQNLRILVRIFLFLFWMTKFYLKGFYE